VPIALVSRSVWGYYAGAFAASSGVLGFFAAKCKNLCFRLHGPSDRGRE
jgi:hypothetical protein